MADGAQSWHNAAYRGDPVSISVYQRRSTRLIINAALDAGLILLFW